MTTGMADDEQALHRQVHPSFIQAGRITRLAFTPRDSDAGLLSVYDAAQILAEASFVHYTTKLKLAAAGTVSVTSAEVEELGLPWRVDGVPFQEHAVIDFTALLGTGQSKTQIAAAVKTKAEALTERARQRGWTYFPA